MGQPDPFWRTPPFVIKKGNSQPIGHHIKHRHRDRHPLTRDATRDQRL